MAMARLKLFRPKNYDGEVAVKKIEYFDYRRVAKEMRVPEAILKRIEKEVKKEFPSDQMMYELHVLRAVKSKYWQKSMN
jgi:hypothetical protein